MESLTLWALLLLPPTALALGCPTGCQCSQPQVVFCAGRRSHEVPRGLPPDTTSLYAFENGITALGDGSFRGLPVLQQLDLSQNEIAALQGDVFQPLSSLVNLDLSSNQLREITNETFRGLRRLERLYLERNQIQHIHPAAFDTLENLLELKLQHNQLRSVPPLNLPSLLLLDVSHNAITALEAGAFRAGNLESLRVAGLGLSRLDEELFESLENLHELDVSDNALGSVPAVLRRLRGLTKLSLAGNARIAQLRAEDFGALRNLQELDISNLNLNTIPRDFFSGLPRLRAVTAAENPFNCVCPLSWLTRWLRGSPVALRRSEETRCHFPPKNAAKLLQHLEYADFGCPATPTPTPTPGTTSPLPAGPFSTSRPPPPAASVAAPTAAPVGGSSTLAPLTAPQGPTSPARQLCPPRTCLNGGTCWLDTHHHLQCRCPAGFSGPSCEAEVRRTTTAPDTQVPARGKRISVKQVGSSSLTVDLRSYQQAKDQLKGVRLTYRNLSGPDKRPVTLSLPTSLSEYTVRALRPNATYRLCAGPLGEKPSEGEFCLEARTAPAAPVTHQQHLPVTQTKDGNLTLMVVPAVAAVLLLVIAVAAVTYYLRHRRAKAQDGPGVDASPLELEGVKTCLENKDLAAQNSKPPEDVAAPNDLDCEAPLMHQRYPSNNNTPAGKPAYF
ncbi:vasorin [Carettochelys insculpta]|uniref:vasorin n=1 Tax=Carettochelys insculpta TaxID=44489 RepID=UPI003EBA4974